jgi:hypothetical protein
MNKSLPNATRKLGQQQLMKMLLMRKLTISRLTKLIHRKRRTHIGNELTVEVES